MPVINCLQEVLISKGIKTAYQFKKKTGLGQGTALKAWKNRNWIPDPKTLEIICETFDIQPGDFLIYEKE